MNNENRSVLTQSNLVSAVMRELVARMARADICTLVNHKENCQWTVYELRRKYLGFATDPIKDGKALSKPHLTLDQDHDGGDEGEGEGDEDDDTDSIVH